jgi:hypothetical protein
VINTLLFLLLFAGIPVAQTRQLPPPIEAAPKADSLVTWQTEQDHDFGEIPRGKPVIFVFTFKNTDSAPISIETVRTTCGCTAAEWTQDAILPGETGQISIEYDAYKSGAFRKKIKVFFDRQKKGETLWIRGEVEG